MAEIALSNQQFVCPTLPKGTCPWQGTTILQHLKDNHENCFKATNTVRIDVRKQIDIFVIFQEDGKYFALQLIYERSKGITITLEKIGTHGYTFNDYTLNLHSLDFEICHTYKVTTKQHFIDYNILKFISLDLILLEINFGSTLNKIDKSILNALECPICLKTMQTNNICQCVTGHSFCEDCFGELHECPLCKKELAETFNYALMQMRSQVLRTCKNKSLGCNFQGLRYQIIEHETHCCRFKCTLCTFQGDEQLLLQHITTEHKQAIVLKNTISWSTTDKSTGRYFIYAYNRIFSIVRLSTENDLVWAVLVYNGKEVAEAYDFSVQFQCGNNELSFKDVCGVVEEETDVLRNGLRISYYNLRRFEIAGMYKCRIDIINRFM